MITPSFGLTATERVLPKLALDFTTASLDSRVTFTRTTSASNPATYVNSSGVITAATNNQPRFDYDPVTLACKGLLIEESRSNSLSYSQTFDNAAWAGNNATINAAAAISPDGTNNAYSLIENTATGIHRINRASVVTVTNGVTYTATGYFKSNGRNIFRLYFTDNVTSWAVEFNLTTVSTSVSGLNAPASYGISAVGNGWFRCFMTMTAGATQNVNAWQVRLCSAAGTESYTGNGTSGIYIWGAQMEAGAFATSYIPTTTTALTRNADVATMTGSNFSDWFNASEGTFVANSAALVASGYSRAVQVSDNTTSNFINVTTNTSQIRTGGVFQASFTSGGSVVAGQYYQTSLAYKLNDCASATNGGTTLTDTSVTLPTVNQMVIGGQTTTNIGSGYIRKIMYWPSRLTNAEVQAFSKQG